MDELIYILIKLIAELFGGGQNKPKGPGFPNLPPRQPSTPPPPLPEDARRRLEELQKKQQQARSPQRQPQRRPPPPITKPPVTRKAPVRVAAPPPPQVTAVRPALVPTAPAPAAVKRPSVAVDAAALRRWLRPQTLHNQFMLSEIFQPPVALRK
jgi:hypothetical protein